MLTAGIEQMVAQAFHTEDEPMIATVQAHMNGRALLDMDPVMLSVDTGAMRARRILQEMVANEHGAPPPERRSNALEAP